MNISNSRPYILTILLNTILNQINDNLLNLELCVRADMWHIGETVSEKKMLDTELAMVDKKHVAWNPFGKVQHRNPCMLAFWKIAVTVCVTQFLMSFCFLLEFSCFRLISGFSKSSRLQPLGNRATWKRLQSRRVFFEVGPRHGGPHAATRSTERRLDGLKGSSLHKNCRNRCMLERKHSSQSNLTIFE